MKRSYYLLVFFLLISIITILPGGCGTTYEVKYYVLSPIETTEPTTPGNVSEGIAVAVGPIKLAEQLKRSQIVTRLSQNQVNISEFNQWGGSLEDDFANVLSENLSILLNSGRVFIYPSHLETSKAYRVEIEVSRFDGTLGQEAILKGRWIIYRAQASEPTLMKRFFLREPVSDNSYAALVAAQSRALGKLSRHIADAIKALSQE